MSAWRPKGRSVFKLRVPLRSGGWVIRSSGSEHRATVRAMERMLHAIGPRGSREWDVLEAVVDGRLTVGQLFDAHRMNDLAGLRARLADVDLMPCYREWDRWVGENLAPLTLDAYRVRLRGLVPQDGPWLRSTLTPKAVRLWLNGVAGSPRNKTAHLVALQSFVAYAREAGVLESDPVEGVRRPKIKATAIRFLELEDVVRVVDAAEGRYRVLFAVLHGAGMEISAALKLTRRHFDVPNRALRIPGRKGPTRDRSGMVASWAWPIIEAHISTMLPDAKVFGGLSRIKAGERWRKLTRALGVRQDAKGRGGATLHDARHHWAVRMLRAGTPAEIVARQLGHSSTKMTLDTYGRYVPGYAELREWEARAAEMDQLRATQTATKAVVGGAKLVSGNGMDRGVSHFDDLHHHPVAQQRRGVSRGTTPPKPTTTHRNTGEVLPRVLPHTPPTRGNAE